MQLEEIAPLERESSTTIDPAAETQFDDAARLASVICRTPTGMGMLLDPLGHWSRASGSLRLREPAVSASFCKETVRRGHALIVEDTLRNEHFYTDPQVIGEPRLRFYAGVSIPGRDGRPAGVLCVTDLVPRVLTSEQEDALEILARQLQAGIQLTDTRRELAALHRERESSAANLRASEELFRAFMNASPFLSYIKDAAGRLLFYNRSFARRFGISEFAWLGKTDEQLWARNMAASMRLQELEVMAGGRMVEAEERLRAADGTVTSWKTYRFPCYDSQPSPGRCRGRRQ